MSVGAAFFSAGLLALQSVVLADTPTNIFNPATAPTIKIVVKLKQTVHPAHQAPGVTTLEMSKAPPTASFNKVVVQGLAGAAGAPNDEMHIRGSHGQYSYYLDGAPLPTSVTGSFSDLVSPRVIQTLRVIAGGFPAELGGQLAAVFDVTTLGGKGVTGGYLQQIAGNYNTFQSSFQDGAASGNGSYFVSGIRQTTDFKLSPVSSTPFHNAGAEDDAFGKFEYDAGPRDRFLLDAGATAGLYQIPNTPDRQALGQDDRQQEDGSVANLIWRHSAGTSFSNIAFYSHDSRLRYFGSPADLLPSASSPSVSGLISTNEDRSDNYRGVRADWTWKLPGGHTPKIGFDGDDVGGSETFSLASPTSTGIAPIIANGPISGSDRSAYVQDDWRTHRVLLNYGLRYDKHSADITTSQYSPRVNMTYTADSRDQAHLFYDRLFQPASIEDVQKLVGNSNIGDNSTYAPFQPERASFYEAGYQRKTGGHAIAIAAYYRDEINTIDDAVLGNTQIVVPINFAK